MFNPGDVIKVTPIIVNEKGEGVLPLGNTIIIVKDGKIGETSWVRIRDIRKVDNWIIIETEKIKETIKPP